MSGAVNRRTNSAACISPPGDNHGNCVGNGPGITQTDGIKALINWVEHGVAPEAIRVVQVDKKTGKTICERTQMPY